ncbi:hypothetical protein DFO77_10183 [Marinilabilia salmonicolor]|jgi:hypothetical protein|uniref:Uncharacterized protein n=1 Tax=Marinilabilia salmonicolor TaxID=989 RepID=A0A2T0XQV1_9BACT|nr:hypothetical protein BY457_103101 [Marinilabilia salmonicolor]RCW39314.1 hypothetical protein DFO77_10183 [Marinilabilia salmonicolor]
MISFSASIPQKYNGTVNFKRVEKIITFVVQIVPKNQKQCLIRLKIYWKK